MKLVKRVGLWIRVSTDDQARGESPATHRSRGEMWAQFRDVEIVTVYDLSGVSGKSVLGHPEAKRMFRDVAEGKIDAVVFSKLARLGRNVRELLEIAEYVEKHQASLISIEEAAIDTSSAAGRLLFVVIGALAQWEREELSARVRASVPIRASKGKSTGGIAPFGYRWDDNRLVIDSEYAPAVRRAFEVYSANGKVLGTCNQLNAEGLRTRNGGLFTTTTLRRVLEDPAYAGNRRANYTQAGKNKTVELKPREEWVFQKIEPLISEELWEKCQSFRAANNRAQVPRESTYLFGGLVRCACNNKKIYVAPYEGMQDPRYCCKNCKEKVNEGDLERHLLEGLKGIMVPADIAVTDNQDDDELGQKEAYLQKLKRNLLSLEQKERALWDLLVRKPELLQISSSHLQETVAQKEQLKAAIEKVEAEIDMLTQSYRGRTLVSEKAEHLAEVWGLLVPEEKRKLLREVLEEVSLSGDQLVFSFYHFGGDGFLEKGDHISMDSWRRPA